MRESREAPRDFCFSDAGRANHDDVLRCDLIAQLGRKLLAAPPVPESRYARSAFATMRNAWSWRKYLSRRQSFASSTTARSMLPRYSSSLVSNREKSANESAADPANPARTRSPYSLRTFAAPCFITVFPTVT